MQDKTPTVISGSRHVDERGTISFVNDFDMKEVRRFYRVRNSDKYPVRGWRAHKIEQRWFSVLSGTFNVKIIKIDDWDNPTKTLKAQTFQLSTDSAVLHVPKGYATCLEALELGSEIILFADSLIEDAGKDNYLFPVDYFSN